MKHLYFIVLISSLIFGCSHDEKKKEKKVHTTTMERPTQIPTLAEAYEYGLPLVLMDIMKENSTNVNKPDKKQGRAPVNQFSHFGPVTSPDFKSFKRPDTEAYYSLAWLDLSKGPVVLETADTQGRFYMMPLLDAWSNVYATIGKRTTGTFPNRYLIVGPNWNGTLPSGAKAIRSPTEMSWVVGRMLSNGSKDAKVASKIQKDFKIYPFRISDEKYVPPSGIVDANLQPGPALDKMFTLSAEDYFNRLNRLMATNPPAKEDQAILTKVARFGIAPGGTFNASSLDEQDKADLVRLPEMMRMNFEQNKGLVSGNTNGWMTFRNSNEFKSDYYRRAYSVYKGAAIDPDADLIKALANTDQNGNPLNGEKKYVLHFNKNDLPKVNERWSLTVYDADGRVVKNKLNRFSVGSKTANLAYNSDGSLDIFIESSTPGKIRESNWLPIPKGDFQVMARLYSPKPEVLSNDWSLPPIKESGNTQSLSLFLDGN